MPEEAERIAASSSTVSRRINRCCCSTRAVVRRADLLCIATVGRAPDKRGMWMRWRSPPSARAVEYEDRQQIMATFTAACPIPSEPFLEKRPADFVD